MFRTAAPGSEPFEFLYLGDAQNSIWSLWSRTVRTAVREDWTGALGSSRDDSECPRAG